jgi:uncharacterized protein (TIGR02996 family)
MSFDKHTQQALLQAILDEPEADAPRLVYADWLEEHGDLLPQGGAAATAYAGFIRKQIELAKVPEYDPLWVRTWFEDRDAISGRGFEAFCPPLPEGVRPGSWCFHRGFLERIEVQSLDTFLTHAQALFAAAPLHEFRLRADYRGAPPNLAALASSPYLSRLRRLIFHLSRLPATEIDEIQNSCHAGNVREMDFEFAGIAEDGCQALFRPPLIAQLNALRLNSNSAPWTEALTEAFLEAGGPYRLRKLTLRESTSSHLPVRVFAAPLLGGLTELDLGGYHLGPDGIARLVESPALDRLESLGLAKTFPQVEGIRALAGCAKLAALRRLDLGSNRLGPVAARLLAQSPHLANLRVLELNSNPLADRGVQALAASPYLSDLVHLDLMQCEIGDPGAAAMLESPHLEGLIRLFVYGDSRKNTISDRMQKRLNARFRDRLFG